MKKFLNNLTKINFSDIILLTNKNFKFITFCTVFFAVILYGYTYSYTKKTQKADIYFEYSLQPQVNFFIFNHNLNLNPIAYDSSQKVFNYEKLKLIFHNKFFSKYEFGQFLRKKFPNVNDNQILILERDFSVFDGQKFFTLYSSNASFELIIQEYIKHINNLTTIQARQDASNLLTEIIKTKKKELIYLENFLSDNKSTIKTEIGFSNYIFLNETYEKNKVIKQAENLINFIKNAEFNPVYISKIKIKKNNSKIYLVSFLGAMFGFLFSLSLLIMKKIIK
jgi:hypothetical protein